MITNASASQGNSDRPQVAISIANTIAHLLSFLVEDIPRKIIVNDLLSLLRDCAVVISGNILPSSIMLWEQTAKVSSEKSMACCLKLGSLEEAWLLQTVSMTILHTYLTMNKAKTIAADANMSSSSGGDRPVPSGNVDMIFSPTVVDKTSMKVITTILRHMLLSPSSSAVDNKRLLLLRQYTALRVLKQVFKGWKLDCVAPATLIEASVLVVRACNEYLASSKTPSKDIETMLSELLVDVMMSPPRARGWSSLDHAIILVHRHTLLPLLECTESIAKRRNQMRSILDSSIFRWIHVVLHRRVVTEPPETAAGFCLAHGIIPHLVDCLGDLNIVSFTSGILSRLVDEGSLMEGVRDIARFSASAMPSAKEDRDSVAGSKRKRESQRKESSIPWQALDMSPSLRSPGRRIYVSQKKQNSYGDFHTYPCQMSSEVRRLMEMALYAGRRLASWFKQESKRDDIKDRDVALLLGSIRFMLSQVWEHSTQMNVHSLNRCVDLIHVLLKYLKGCSDELMKSGVNSWSASHLGIAQAITSTGLYLHFFINGISSCLTKGQVHALKTVIEDFTHLASRLTLADLPAEASGLSRLQMTQTPAGNFATSGIGLQMLETIQSSESDKIRAELLFPLVANATGPLNQRELSNHPIDLDRSIVLFDLLPLRSRYGMGSLLAMLSKFITLFVMQVMLACVHRSTFNKRRARI